MGIISSILLVLFVISAILMILLVIFQDDQGEGIGGLFASGNSPFRSRSGNLLQYVTTGVAIFFFVSALGYAVLMKPNDPLGNLAAPAEDGTFLETLLEGESSPNAPEELTFDFNNFNAESNSNAIGLSEAVGNE